MAARGKKVAPKKKANGYKMPPPIPQGEVIYDTIGKKKWRIGPSIGVGGFGEIYVACDDDNPPKKGSNYPYVVKIEPHENGPLFVEKHFYVRSANKDDIQNFMKSKKLSSLGMPAFYGSGSHEFRGEKFRYLVLERYGADIWKIFKEAGRVFPAPTVFQLGLQMLDVVEYIHSRGYVHADLKGSNILLGIKKGTENQAYLLDFGLAQKLTDKEFKPEPKNAHNGTIEYTSRDAHLGVPTMRGDLEILGYNLLQWLVGELPWEKNLTNQKKVQEMKEELLKDVRATISKKYPKVPDALIKFFEYVNTLKPKEQPDYTKCRQIFESYLKSVGKTRSSKLEFTATAARKTKPAAADCDSDDKPLKQNGDAPKAKRVRKPKVKTLKSDNENELLDNDDLPLKQTEDAPKPRRRKPKPLDSDSENEPNNTPVKKTVTKKRKSLEPSVVVKVKKTKLTPKATPPAKENYINIATQTSEPRQTRNNTKQVTFVSPNKTPRLSNSVVSNSVNSSGDIFDDSFEIQKVKPKRKLLAEEEVTQTRVVKKKVTVKKGKSWKDTSAVVNGRSPPK